MFCKINCAERSYFSYRACGVSITAYVVFFIIIISPFNFVRYMGDPIIGIDHFFTRWGFNWKVIV